MGICFLARAGILFRDRIGIGFDAHKCSCVRAFLLGNNFLLHDALNHVAWPSDRTAAAALSIPLWATRNSPPTGGGAATGLSIDRATAMLLRNAFALGWVLAR